MADVPSNTTNDHVASTTTFEQDLKSAGQRQINLIWEKTQRQIAVFVIAVACLVAGYVIIMVIYRGEQGVGGGDSSITESLVLAAFTLLSNISFLVAGFYFGRTNHARIGDSSKNIIDTR